MQDLFSRFVVGWTVAETQTASLGQNLFLQTCDLHQITPDSVVLHSDRGVQMTAKSWAELERDLCISQSFSRPRVSNDNPYSESQFKTLKYRPQYPGYFNSIEDARLEFRAQFLLLDFQPMFHIFWRIKDSL